MMIGTFTDDDQIMDMEKKEDTGEQDHESKYIKWETGDENG